MLCVRVRLSKCSKNLQEIEDEGEIYESIEDIWPDYPSKDDFFFNEEEYHNLTSARMSR